MPTASVLAFHPSHLFASFACVTRVAIAAPTVADSIAVTIFSTLHLGLACLTLESNVTEAHPIAAYPASIAVVGARNSHDLVASRTAETRIAKTLAFDANAKFAGGACAVRATAVVRACHIVSECGIRTRAIKTLVARIANALAFEAYAMHRTPVGA